MDSNRPTTVYQNKFLLGYTYCSGRDSHDSLYLIIMLQVSLLFITVAFAGSPLNAIRY